MNESDFQREFERLSPVIGPSASDYPDDPQWEALGTDSRDVDLTQVADLYLQATTEQREAMHWAVDYKASWSLLTYIRRIGLLMLVNKNSQWYWRGLAIADLGFNALFGVWG